MWWRPTFLSRSADGVSQDEQNSARDGKEEWDILEPYTLFSPFLWGAARTHPSFGIRIWAKQIGGSCPHRVPHPLRNTTSFLPLGPLPSSWPPPYLMGMHSTLHWFKCQSACGSRSLARGSSTSRVSLARFPQESHQTGTHDGPDKQQKFQAAGGPLSVGPTAVVDSLSCSRLAPGDIARRVPRNFASPDFAVELEVASTEILSSACKWSAGFSDGHVSE